MSYTITVIKDADGLRVKESASTASVPEGTFTIEGHEPAPDMSDVATIGVRYTDASGQWRGGSSGSRKLTRVRA